MRWPAMNEHDVARGAKARIKLRSRMQPRGDRHRGFDLRSGGLALLDRFRFGETTHRLIAPRSTSRSGAANVMLMTPRSARHTTRYSSRTNAGSPSTVYVDPLISLRWPVKVSMPSSLRQADPEANGPLM